MFQRKYSKWLPLASYNSNNNDIIIFARVNKKTGMFYFKSKHVTNRLLISSRCVFPNSIIDIQKQWDALIKMIE